MTKRDFFRVVIKLMGIYTLIGSVFGVLPSVVPMFMSDIEDSFSIIFISIAIIVGLVLLIMLLFFYTDRLITFFKLDKGYDTEQVSLGALDFKVLIQLVLVFIGLQLIVDYSFEIIHEILFLFKNKIMGDIIPYRTLDIYDWLFKILRIILGFVLILNLDYLAGKIIKIGSKKQSNQNA